MVNPMESADNDDANNFHAAKNRVHIFTPRGVPVPGVSTIDGNIALLWERYSKLMGRSPMSLIGEGYRAMTIKERKEFEP